MHTYVFTGTLTTREPLAYSPPNHRGPTGFASNLDCGSATGSSHRSPQD